MAQKDDSAVLRALAPSTRVEALLRHLSEYLDSPAGFTVT